MKRNRYGFTLLEMLIVVAIIGILVATAVPAFANSLKRSKAAACMANRRSAKAELTAEVMLSGIDQEKFAPYLKKYSCPKKGVITAKYDAETGQVNVYCSEHEPGFSMADLLYQNFESKYKKYIEEGKKSWEAEGNIRTNIYNEKGGWDEIEFAGNSDTFYVKPKYKDEYKLYFVYANKESQLKNGAPEGGDWTADYIYNHEDHKWYCPPEGVESPTIDKITQWSQIKEIMETQGWRAVSVKEESPKKLG